MITQKTSETNGWLPPTFKQLQKKGSLTLDFGTSGFVKSPQTYQQIYIEQLKAVIQRPSGGVIECLYDGSETFTVILSEEGEYVIRFQLTYVATTSVPNRVPVSIRYKTNREAYFAVAPEEQLTPYTVKDVIDRTLDLTPTRTIEGENKYTFRNNALEYATIEAPEFTFTGKHLFEVMLDIASYQKKFPAMYKKEIYFRPFWNGVTLTSDDLPPCSRIILNSAIDQYCNVLDSYVENMVCINDTRVGTVVEPYRDGYISARSSGGSEISETTAIIPTQSGIYQALALLVGETDGVEVGDVQSYVYEQEEYDSLSDTSAAYPYSKGYALKFTRFQKDYTELAHRIQPQPKDGSSLAVALINPALGNIVEAKTGNEVGMSLKEYIKGLLGLSNGNSFADLIFRPTYIPVVNARVRQYKPMYNEEDYDTTIWYNQQSEVVDSEAFGEHIKGLVQKLGNHTAIKVYRFDKIDDVPTVGTIIDGKSVYDVAMMIFEDHVDATICLVDYAELSTYIGVKNEIKTSDISSTKWCNRFINWEEFFVFTHDDITGDALSVTSDSLNDIVNFTNADPLTCATFTHYTEDGAEISTAFAPIKHLALGNSIYFQWEMLDNFAVGYKSEEAPDGATSVLTGSQYDRAQKAVRYCDMYGRAETVDFKLSKTGPTPENSVFDIPVDLNFQEGKCIVSLQKASGLYIGVTVMLTVESGDENLILNVNNYLTFAPTETSKEFDVDFMDILASSYTVDVLIDTVQQRGAYMRKLAHEYPQKPNDLVFSTSAVFQLDGLLVKKNSAEALKYAAQYHFRQTWRDFIISSGMSNFCSLVGGSCSQVQFFTSVLPINRFDRHINLDDKDNFSVFDNPSIFEVDEANKRVVITLPSGVNASPSIKSWGVVGIDKNGNRQLIFGENRNARNEAFKTTIYLVAKKKN